MRPLPRLFAFTDATVRKHLHVSNIAAALASEGLQEIAADGAFDPHVHEALLVQAAVEASAVGHGNGARLPRHHHHYLRRTSVRIV